MSTWFSKDLGDGVAAYAPTGKMQEAFFAAFMLARGQVDMAMFSRYDLQKNMVTVYFSPSARSVAEAFGATPCEKPSITGLGLEAGDIRCWQALFPGETPHRR